MTFYAPGSMVLGDRWLDAAWWFVRSHLPPAPAVVLEIGCGQLGGFVPGLLDAGYEALGVDPKAPEGPPYRQVAFEAYEAPAPVDAIVSSLALHHVLDLAVVLDRVAAQLAPGGTLVVLEWSWERFDEATARWCFARLDPPAPGEEPTWLHRLREEWDASSQSWEAFNRSWAERDEQLQRGDTILAALDARFERRFFAEGPYFFSDLAESVTEADEQAAIDEGEIQPTGLRYVASRP